MNRVAVQAGVVRKRAAVLRRFTKPDERQADADGKHPEELLAAFSGFQTAARSPAASIGMSRRPE
jgi:hypothetical protein